MVGVTKELKFAFCLILISSNRQAWPVTVTLDSTGVENFLQGAVICASPACSEALGVVGLVTRAGQITQQADMVAPCVYSGCTQA